MFRVRKGLRGYPVLLFHFIAKNLEAPSSYFLMVTQSGPGPSEAVCILMPTSALLSSCTAVPLPAAPLLGSLHLRVEPQAGKNPSTRSHPSSVTAFPEVPLWPGFSPDCRQIQTVDFAFLWLRTHDFPWRVYFKVILQKFNSKILTKKIWRRHKCVCACF